MCGIGFGFPWLAIVTFTFNRVADHEKGAGLGVLTATSDAASFGGAILAGTIAHSLGYSAVFCFGAISILAAGAAVIPAMRAAGAPIDGVTAGKADLVASREAAGAADR